MTLECVLNVAYAVEGKFDLNWFGLWCNLGLFRMLSSSGDFAFSTFWLTYTKVEYIS